MTPYSQQQLSQRASPRVIARFLAPESLPNYFDKAQTAQSHATLQNVVASCWEFKSEALG
jgi:hypothetical protein